MDQPLVSLIVVTFNSAGLLPPFLAALAATRYPRYELIVVDNHSADPTVAVAQAAGAQVIAAPENLGFGRACNAGAAAAAGEWLVFLNPDVLVPPDWLERLIACGQANPRLGIFCPQNLFPGQLWEPAAALKPYAAVPGSTMVVSRPVWDALGGFDPALFLYWEDTELCWRAWLRGWIVAADLNAMVYHERGGSAGFSRWDRERTKNSLYTYLKLMRWRKVVPFAAVLLLKTLVKSVIYRDPGLWGAWLWNLRHLPRTLRARRAERTRRVLDPRRLELLLRAYAADQAHVRRQRRAAR